MDRHPFHSKATIGSMSTMIEKIEKARTKVPLNPRTHLLSEI